MNFRGFVHVNIIVAPKEFRDGLHVSPFSIILPVWVDPRFFLHYSFHLHRGPPPAVVSSETKSLRRVPARVDHTSYISSGTHHCPWTFKTILTRCVCMYISVRVYMRVTVCLRVCTIHNQLLTSTISSLLISLQLPFLSAS